MRKKYDVSKLLDKYNIKLKTTREEFKVYEEVYNKIDATLNYLINELAIPTTYIETHHRIIYKNSDMLKKNVDVTKKLKITFEDLETFMKVISNDYRNIIDIYDYMINKFGINVINDNPKVLSWDMNTIKRIDSLNLPITKSDLMVIMEKVFQQKKDVEELNIVKKSFLEPISIEELEILANSKEYKENKELYTNAKDILSKIYDAKLGKKSEGQNELETLSQNKKCGKKNVIMSEEYQKHPELFQKTTLKVEKYEEIKKILNSKEYREHSELFTATNIAHLTLEEVQEILNSKEYKEHPELFTAETLTYEKYKEIKEFIKSEIYQKHPEIFNANLFTKTKSIRRRLPITFEIAKMYGIEEYLTQTFLLFQPEHNYALIRYMNDNNIPLVVDNKLNKLFYKQPGELMEKYKIDMKELMDNYKLDDTYNQLKHK